MKYIFVFIAFLGFASISYAQCGVVRKHYVYPNTYQYPVKEVVVKENIVVKEVIVPVSVPVLVPAFQFQYVPPPCIPAVAAPPVHAQKAAPPMAPNMASLPKDQIRILARAILEEMNREVVSGNGNGNGNGNPPPPPPPDGGPPPVPPADGFQATPQNNALAVLQNRCGSCHTGATSKSGIVIFSAPGQFNPGIDRQRIIESIEQGRMPKGADTNPQLRLSQQEREMIRAFLGN